jgi:hypothetical protein
VVELEALFLEWWFNPGHGRSGVMASHRWDRIHPDNKRRDDAPPAVKQEDE